LKHLTFSSADVGDVFIFKATSARISFVISRETILGRLADDGITGHFNSPSAPHFGGLWDTGVKSMKHHLKRTVGDRTLTYEELATVLAQIEACSNSLPLYPRNSEGISDGLSPRSILSWSYSLCQQAKQ